MCRLRMGRVMAVLVLVVLAGCGADGEPVQPTFGAAVGVSSDGGVTAAGGVGLHKGPFSLFFGV